MDAQTMNRNKRRAELTFAVLDAMEDLREVWRWPVPTGDLDETQRADAEKRIAKTKKAIEELEKLL